jgi:LacI family transcriptional regulator
MGKSFCDGYRRNFLRAWGVQRYNCLTDSAPSNDYDYRHCQPAGVSRATVSYVLNARSTQVRISDQTRQRVEAAALELGYQRNELARAVTTGQSRMLGFWVMQSQHEPVARVLAGAMKEADANDYFIKMLGFDNSTLDAQIIDRCVAWRVSGIIAIHAPYEALEAVYPQLISTHIPVVLVDSQAQCAGSIHIASDQVQGVRSVVAHLVDLGHKRIAHIAGRQDPSWLISHQRVEAYRTAMKEFGLSRHEQVVYGNWDADDTEMATRQLLSLPLSRRPTAIACWSDYTAMAVMRAASRMGVRVPQDLSVAGFDDLSVATLLNPPLTTVAQSFEEMGRRAVRRLLSNIDTSEHMAATEEALTTNLVVRESTAAPSRPSKQAKAPLGA